MNQTKLLSIACFGLAAVSAFADTPGRHPYYLHARSDLRRAHRLLSVRDEPNVMRDMQRADRSVLAAIAEIDQAAMYDRKDIDDNPPVDVNIDRPGRFRMIADLINGAKRDLARAEDNPAAAGWRNNAYCELDEALNFVRQAARDDWRDDMMREGDHPHYLRALSDLRLARALLDRPEDGDVAADQRRAIHELNEALNEISRAAITDGKDLGFRPPIDTSLNRPGRFNKALDLMNSAMRDLQAEEDNRAALGWRARAMDDLRDAIEFARRARFDDRRE